MEVITTHSNADFDAVASMVAAQKLYPDAVKVLPGSAEANVRRFLKEYPQEILRSNKARLEKIEKLILVDTRQRSRIGKFSEIAEAVPVYVYDHHPAQSDDIRSNNMEVSQVGATITILLERIRKKGIRITKDEAVLFCLGIYEDTGSLLFPTTTLKDLEALSFLLEHGAELSTVARYLTYKPTKAQILILSDLLRSKELHTINGAEVAIATACFSEYVEDLSFLAHHMMDIEKPDALFCLIRICECIHIIARSRKKEIDVGTILSKFGGGGHAQAASVTIKGKGLSEMKDRILSALRYGSKNLSSMIEERLVSWMRYTILLSCKIADEMKVDCFIVGGFVRDLILNRENFDLDMVVIGDGIGFAKKLANSVSSSDLTIHQRFRTAQITLKNGAKIDIATARRERYPQPGALPEIEPGTLKRDLARRDFTINTLAVCINSKRFGELIDFYGGAEDISHKVIRMLHPKSFIDDPTRIFRAVRFESRLSFKMDKETEKRAREVARMGYLQNLSIERLQNELILILSDERPEEALKRLSNMGMLKLIHPNLILKRNLFLSAHNALFYLSVATENIDMWILHFLVLVDSLTEDETERLIAKLRFTSSAKRKITEAKRETKSILSFLKRPNLKNSSIYKKLIKLSQETLVFAVAKTRSLLVKRRIHLFLTSLKDERTYLSGDDLIKMGLKPGPLFKRVLERLLWLKLDREIKDKDDEVKYILDKFKKE
jgi:tRNA nucleotidyltransferase/poly(A) polymerase/nanoRNase/pAp phosphatase (c-di-AMP/oligoRNAs hydrolase)